MLTLLLWRKVSSSVNFLLIPFAFLCIRRRQFVGVGVETGLWFISISPAHRSRSRKAVSASAAQPPKAILRVDKFQKFWLSTVSVGDPAAKWQLPF